MAYRQGGSVKAPAYLEEFLDRIETLPAQIKGKFAEMRELDERSRQYAGEAEKGGAEAARRAQGKGVSNESLKKAYLEVISLQGKALEDSDNKVAIAEQAFEVVDDVIRSLDDKLKEFETQLRKEGRWPASVADKPPRAPAEAPANPPAPQKSRRRERDASASTGGARAPAAGTQHGTIKVQQKAYAPQHGDGSVAVIEDMAVDPNEPRYCYCRQISYGEMVECEGEDCPYGWFHFQCVGLSDAPKGQWRCPDCEKPVRRKSDT